MTVSQLVSDHVDSVSVREVLDWRMRTRLETVARRLDQATKDRDEAIIAAHTAGASLREIAKPLGLSGVGVMKILRRHGISGK